MPPEGAGTAAGGVTGGGAAGVSWAGVLGGAVRFATGFFGSFVLAAGSFTAGFFASGCAPPDVGPGDGLCVATGAACASLPAELLGAELLGAGAGCVTTGALATDAFGASVRTACGAWVLVAAGCFAVRTCVFTGRLATVPAGGRAVAPARPARGWTSSGAGGAAGELRTAWTPL